MGEEFRRAALALAIALGMTAPACGDRGRKVPRPTRVERVQTPQRYELPVPTISLAEATKPPGGSALWNQANAEGLGYPRYPDHFGGVVVFCAEGDLWQVSVRGGLARRLTVHQGEEIFPKFSPDGKWLAFSGRYDGNQDVFVMPAVGGVPRRLTFHPAPDQVLGWTPDGKSVLFRSTRYHAHRQWTLHTVPRAGGDPTRLPLARGARLSWEPGGKRVAINRLSREFRTWKRYAGGRAAQISIGDLDGGAFRRITTFLGTNAFPMWHGGRIYFLSDRTGTLNLWSTTPTGSDLQQHTKHTEFDARFPSLGQGKIVYQHRAGLRLLDLATGKDAEIPVRVVSDALRTRNRFTQASRYLSGFDLAPDGSRLAVVVRGNLHVIPAAEEGRRIELSPSSGSRERGISFSPDGKRIATISDRTGEAEVFLLDAAGVKPPQQLTRDGTAYKYSPNWSPDGKWIVYATSDNRLMLAPTIGGAPQEIYHAKRGRVGGYRWSPDSQWIAFSAPRENYFSSIFLYGLARRQVVPVTSEHHYDWNPTWSADGKYLAFLSERTINPILDQKDLETIDDKMIKPYLVLLRDKMRSPFLPKLPGARPAGKKKRRRGQPKRPVQVRVDVAGLGERIIEVPVPEGHLRGLYAGKGFLTYVRYPTMGMAERRRIRWHGKERLGKLMRFDIDKKKEKTYLAGIRGYAVSANGKRIAVRRARAKFVVFDFKPSAPKGKALAKAAVPVGRIREVVEPRAEWRQIFDEVWRTMRDFYFTPTMGKVDWKAVWRKYRALLPHVTTRSELNDLLGEMVGELSLGHTYIWGGDRQRSRGVRVGLLGADLAPDPSGYYRFRRIYRGTNWDKARRSPLTMPHVGVRAGDYLIRINGRPVRAGENVYRRLQNAAGVEVQLTVNTRPSALGARDVEVTTLRSESAVRYESWVRRNREYVADKTQGRVGYLHIPDMGASGMIEFDRWFYPQLRKQALVVDARWNRGGFVSQIMIKRLARKVLSWAHSRRGYVTPYPARTLNGPIVVLTNESAGSDGDIFPRAIQVAKLGKVVGTRTWGGVVGINLRHPLVDRGLSTRPTYFAWWEPKRRYRLEGEGVHPDIVVDTDPAAVERGRDAQLDKGIAVILEELRKRPSRVPDFGPPPDKSKKAWVKRYGKTDKP